MMIFQERSNERRGEATWVPRALLPARARMGSWPDTRVVLSRHCDMVWTESTGIVCRAVPAFPARSCRRLVFGGLFPRLDSPRRPLRVSHSSAACQVTTRFPATLCWTPARGCRRHSPSLPPPNDIATGVWDPRGGFLCAGPPPLPSPSVCTPRLLSTSLVPPTVRLELPLRLAVGEGLPRRRRWHAPGIEVG